MATEEFNRWKCLNCEGQPEFEHKDFGEHLSQVHGLDPKNTKGQRRVLMHADGQDFFRWDHEWTIGDLKFIQSTQQRRRGGNYR